MRSAPDRLARIVPPPGPLTADAHRAVVEDAVGAALMLTGIVRDLDPADAAEFVAGLPVGQAEILPYVLAAMVDVDKTSRELFAWLGWRSPVRYDGATAVSPGSTLLHRNPRTARSRDCGSEGGWREHGRDGSRKCERCLIAHDAYVRDERARDRDAARLRRTRAATTPLRLVAVAAPTLPFGDANVA
jgi:hypothetical protein